VTVFGVEDGSPTNRAEPEYKLGSLIPDAKVFGGGTEDFERSGEARQCREDTAGPLLAGEAVAEADSSRLTFDLNAELAARARGCSGRHWAPRRRILVTPKSRGHSIKELPRCGTVEMPDPHSDKSRRLEVHRVHRNGRVAAFLPIRVVCDATTFLASIIGANLPVP
jgi:hypothetical protein